MSSGTRWSLIYMLLTVGSYLYPGGRGRVMVLPFLFMAIIAMLFASAQRSAARQDAEES
jgi:hypothetical protein